MLKQIAISLSFCVSYFAAAKSILEPGETLVEGRYLQSPNLCFKLEFRNQGNLVIVNKSNKVIWSSETYNTFATQLYLDYGSNLRLQTTSGVSINWQTKTSGAFGFLRLQNDGNLVIYSDSFVPLWNTGTYNSSCG